MNNPKIALADMDGTLCDYEGALKKELHRVLGEEVDVLGKSMVR